MLLYVRRAAVCAGDRPDPTRAASCSPCEPDKSSARPLAAGGNESPCFVAIVKLWRRPAGELLPARHGSAEQIFRTVRDRREGEGRHVRHRSRIKLLYFYLFILKESFTSYLCTVGEKHI